MTRGNPWSLWMKFSSWEHLSCMYCELHLVERVRLVKMVIIMIILYLFNIVASTSSKQNVSVSTINCPSSVKRLVFKTLNFPPYIHVSKNGSEVRGELKDVMEIAVRKCCTRTIDTSFLNIDEKISSSDDIELMIRTTEAYESLIFFPVFANRASKEQYDRNFIGLFESPGFAILKVQREELVESANDQIDALVQAWPILMVCVLCAILAGVIMWVLDCRQNKEFSVQFIPGAGAGIWWSFVTMTTVGYGDKSPRSCLGRFFAVVWMVIGTILLSMVSAQITAYLTSLQVAETFSIQSQKVAVPMGLQNYLEKEMNLGADLKEYPLKTLMEAVKHENSSILNGRNYIIVHDFPKIFYWMSQANQTLDFRLKLMMNHPIFLGAVATHLPDQNLQKLFDCIGRAFRDRIEIQKIKDKEIYNEAQAYDTKKNDDLTDLRDHSLMYLGAAVGVFLILGLTWELSKRIKNKSVSVSECD